MYVAQHGREDFVPDRVAFFVEVEVVAAEEFFARLAGVNEPKKNCHGVRKARAEVAAYSECTEAQMMAMFGWRDHKMPALYIAKANRDKLAISGMEKIEAYDQMENIADLVMPTDENRIVTFESNRRKKP